MSAQLKRQQKGDTIVEVLIAMAVASSVLATSFITMNRNLLIARTSQERSEAAKYAQGQLEALKATTDAKLPIPAGSFCFNLLTGAISGAPCVSSYYNASIVRDLSAPRQYRITVTWDKLGGGTETTIMAYRTAN